MKASAALGGDVGVWIEPRKKTDKDVPWVLMHGPVVSGSCCLLYCSFLC